MHIQAETYKRVNIIHFNKLISSFSRYTLILLSCNVVLKKTKIAYVGFLETTTLKMVWGGAFFDLVSFYPCGSGI